jgi:hypothetical protein
VAAGDAERWLGANHWLGAERWLGYVSLAVIGLLSGVLAVIGGFLSPAAPRVLGIPVPLGVLVAVVGNLAVGFLGARGTGSRAAPVISALVWVGVSLFLGSSRPEGDLVVTGSGKGVAFLLLGTAAAAAAIGFTPRRRKEPALDSTTPGLPPAPSPDAVARR